MAKSEWEKAIAGAGVEHMRLFVTIKRLAVSFLQLDGDNREVMRVSHYVVTCITLVLEGADRP